MDDDRSKYGSFLRELSRRNVFRVAAGYVVAAWLIIQVAETIFPLFGFDETPARVVVILLAIGLVPVVVFAWAFELTPEGLKREKDVDRSQSITPETGKKLDRMIMVVLALAITYFSIDKFVLDPARDARNIENARLEGRTATFIESHGEKSIAVLPFADLSPERDQEYLSHGLAEEILNLLAGIPELRVISRSSSFSFQGKDVSIPQIAERLHVAHVLEGAVRRSANRIRVTVQLIEGRADRQLWSATYTQTLNDIFAVQEAIAIDVVRQLEPKLVETELRVTPHDPEAYSLLLQANHLSNDPDKLRLGDSIKLYRQALDIEPGLADAWFGIADAYDTLGTIGAMPSSEAQRFALEAAEMGAEIEPESARGQLLLGWIFFNYESDYAEAARRFSRAISIAPRDARTIEFVSSFLAALGRLESAVGLMKYVVSRDPVDAIAHNNLGVFQRWSRQTEDARHSLNTALKLLPEFAGAEYEIGLTYLQDEQPARALEHFERESSEPFRLVGTAMALHALGSQADANSVVDELVQKYGDYVGFYIAQAKAFQNKSDSAFEWLRKAMKDGDHGLSTANVEPMLENLHGDPRWRPFLQELGTSSEQLSVIEFDSPDTLVPGT